MPTLVQQVPDGTPVDGTAGAGLFAFSDQPERYRVLGIFASATTADELRIAVTIRDVATPPTVRVATVPFVAGPPASAARLATLDLPILTDLVLTIPSSTGEVTLWVDVEAVDQV
jgi:hypothetical protein